MITLQQLQISKGSASQGIQLLKSINALYVVHPSNESYQLGQDTTVLSLEAATQLAI